MPTEQIRFHSTFGIHYGNKKYHAILTDRRILLYAKRGTLTKNDDVIMQNLDQLQTIKYQETGLVNKKGTIKIQGASAEMDLWGTAIEVKTLYQQMMHFM